MNSHQFNRVLRIYSDHHVVAHLRSIDLPKINETELVKFYYVVSRASGDEIRDGLFSEAGTRKYRNRSLLLEYRSAFRLKRHFRCHPVTNYARPAYTRSRPLRKRCPRDPLRFQYCYVPWTQIRLPANSTYHLRQL